MIFNRHALLTVAILLLGLGVTAVVIRRFTKAPETPRPTVLGLSLGFSLAMVASAYAGTFAGKVLGLTPPEWLIGFFAGAAFVVVPTVTFCTVIAFIRRHRNRLYLSVWRFSLLVVLAILGLFLVPRPPSASQSPVPTSSKAQRAAGFRPLNCRCA